jgi:hypothetical protein
LPYLAIRSIINMSFPCDISSADLSTELRTLAEKCQRACDSYRDIAVHLQRCTAEQECVVINHANLLEQASTDLVVRLYAT